MVCQLPLPVEGGRERTPGRKQCFTGEAYVLEPTVTDEIYSTVREETQDKGRNCFDNGGKFPFVSPDPFFRLLCRGDVHDRSDKLEAAKFIL